MQHIHPVKAVNQNNRLIVKLKHHQIGWHEVKHARPGPNTCNPGLKPGPHKLATQPHPSSHTSQPEATVHLHNPTQSEAHSNTQPSPK